ncbi:MAG TPA: hypothetical protein VHG51_20075 [Longimicrobiaceae bacterium]|nr:hypothetical protein [Longimicrobiaceae bacterium]
MSITESGTRVYAPERRVREGRELAMVYIGSAACGPSNREDLPGMIEELKLRLSGRAAGSGRSFAAVGIARDWDVREGIAHLEKFGEFDEVATGRSWLNLGTLKYVWEDLPGVAATPQVLVVDRSVGEQGPGREGTQYTVRDEVLIARKVGTDEIGEWLARGAPLPDLEQVPIGGSGEAAVPAGSRRRPVSSP